MLIGWWSTIANVVENMKSIANKQTTKSHRQPKEPKKMLVALSTTFI